MPEALKHETNVGEVISQWMIQDYEHHLRGTTWYVIMITAGIGLVTYGLLSSNFLFSLIIILFAIILFLHEHQEPLQVQFAITELGIVVGSKFYPYTEMENFYIIYDPKHTKTLYLHTKSIARPNISIPLLDQNPIEVRNFLRQYIPEDFAKEDEPLSDAFARNWRIH